MTNRHTGRTTLLIAGAVAAALVFAGCTPTAPTPTPTPTATPTPTPTPTPTEVAAPQSEDEAIDAATDAMNRYITVRTAIYVDPQTPQDFDAVADGTAAERLKSTASQLAELGGHGEGEITFDVESAFATSLMVNGQEAPFSQVNLKGCYDTSEMELFDADGSPSDVAEDRRFIVEPILVYRESTSSWVVYQLDSPEVVEPC